MKDGKLMRKKFNRRRFILLGLGASSGTAAADALWVEPEWLRIRKLRLAKDQPTHRLVHFTDLHHKGDRAYLQRVVKEINARHPTSFASRATS